MAIRIETDAGALARSRFATSPAFDIVATLRGRQSSGLRHARHWYGRAHARLDAATMELLHALVPADHPYVPDFLTPQPGQPRETRDGVVAAVAATPVDEVASQLDHLFDGRPVHQGFADAMGGEATYRRWRRRPPPHVQELLDAGEGVVAVEAAAAMGRFFDAALAEDWPAIAAVLETDIAYRSEVTTSQGIAAMLDTFGSDLRWDGERVSYPSRFEVTVDWAGDGLVFVPCAAHVEPILFRIDRPHSPLVMYAARGTAALWNPTPLHAHGAQLRELLGATRLNILRHVGIPHTTAALAAEDGHAPATISYHLGVLRRAGLVTSQRSGHGVLYRRTALGDALLDGELPGSTTAPGPPRQNP
ncbi:ArsR/SmtB family transcription factor [Nocardioides sp. GXQ0305]|uniref:ArsR/SmtB family transcription factor n=1 Tax=Nocardioides sp. GXQ0305 TaxID=3423912 RepID=UPI003D7D88EC